MPIVLKSGSLNLLETSGPVQACSGIALLTTGREQKLRISLCSSQLPKSLLHLSKVLTPSKGKFLKCVLWLSVCLSVSSHVIIPKLLNTYAWNFMWVNLLNVQLGTLFKNPTHALCFKIHTKTQSLFNPLNPELNPICYLLALLDHHFLHVSRIRVKSLTLRLLMSYIYGAPILDVSRSHTATQHSQ